MKTFKPLLLATAICTAFTLTGCNSSDSDNATKNNSTPETNSSTNAALTKGKAIADIYFVDDNLQSCVEDTGAEFTSQIQALDCAGSDITHLGGIEELESINTLILSHNALADISELSSMQQLVSLYIDNNELFDLSALQNLTGLQQLALQSNKLTSMSDLEQLTRLAKLYVDNNDLTDVSTLAALEKLQHLSLTGNELSQDDLPELNLKSLRI